MLLILKCWLHGVLPFSSPCFLSVYVLFFFTLFFSIIYSLPCLLRGFFTLSLSEWFRVRMDMKSDDAAICNVSTRVGRYVPATNSLNIVDDSEFTRIYMLHVDLWIFDAFSAANKRERKIG